MASNKYLLNKIILKFKNDETEIRYKNYILDKTLLFCRISWVLVILLGGSFAILDQQEFGANGNIVTQIRMIVISLSVIIFILTFFKRVRHLFDLSSSLFIFIVGIFCIFLTAMSNNSSFTPYFTGLFFAFAGVFTTAGLGFRYSFIALILNLIIFNITILLLAPVPFRLIIVYNFFLPGIIIVFAYVSYIIERISRDNFIVSAKLRDSTKEIQTLSGLLPICASCKKIRDDKGYWNQLEEYFLENSDVTFTHSLCPHCTEKFILI